MGIFETIILGTLGSLLAAALGFVIKEWWDSKGSADTNLNILTLSDATIKTTREINQLLSSEVKRIFSGRVEMLTSAMLSHPANPERVNQFYRGAKLDWDIIATQADIARDQHDEFLKQAAQSVDEMRLVCILAEPGAGKSTFAWRIAAELHARHQAVILHIYDNTDPSVWYRLPEFYSKCRRPFYVLVDDIFHERDATAAFNDLKPWLPVTVLATSRPNEFRARRPKYETSCLTLNAPSQDEKGRILQKLGKRQNDLTTEQRIRLDSADQFLVLMMELTEGKELREIVRDTLERLHQLDESSYRAYEYLCFTYQYGVAMPTSLLERLDRRGRFHNLLERENTRGLVFEISREGQSRLRVGHTLIAAISSEFYALSHSPKSAVKEIASAVDAADFGDRLFLASFVLALTRKSSGLLNPVPKQLESIVTTCVHQARRISELAVWRAFYSAVGDDEKAENCVTSALELEPVSAQDCNILVDLFRQRGRPADALPVISNWADRHSDWADAALTYMALTERYGRADDLEKLIRKTSEWLEAHPDDTYVRSGFLTLLKRNDSSQWITQAVAETNLWLDNHLEDSHVRATHLRLLESHGSTEQATQAIRRARVWLSSHPNDRNMRAAYLSVVEGKGTPEQVDQAVQEIGAWLLCHVNAGSIRAAYLGLLERKGTNDQVAQIVEETGAWLSSNAYDRNVRAAYLGLMERRGTPKQVAQVIHETSAWLSSNLDDQNVRAAYLGLMERRGTPKQVAQVIHETSAWLSSNLDNQNVRAAYLGLVAAHGSDTLKEETIADTRDWLMRHQSAKSVWNALLAWLFRSGRTDDAVAVAILAYSCHPQDENLLTQYLRAAQDSGNHETIKKLYEQLVSSGNKRSQLHYAAWLRDHDYPLEAEQQYLDLLSKVPNDFFPHHGYGQLLLRLGRFEEAKLQFRQVLKIHRGHQSAHHGLAWTLWKLGDFRGAEREFKKAVYWAGVNGKVPAKLHTDLGWFYVDRLSWSDALQAFELAKGADPEYFGNYWGIGRALYGLEDYKGAQANLRVAIEKEPNLEPPASVEIPELLAQSAGRITT